MLFQNVNEIKTILPIGVGNDFNRLKPHIQNAENSFIKPLLGLDIYNALVTLYETNESETPSDDEIIQRELLQKVQFATIHLAFHVGFDFLNISVTDAGFQRIETERTKGLFKYQEDAIKAFFAETGYNALDEILTFILFNFDTFKDLMVTDNFDKNKSSFLPNVKAVEEIPFNIHRSNLIFLALKSSIAYIEDTSIRPVLGETIYGQVKTEMLKEAPATKFLLLVDHIRKPLIYLASAMLMEETGATLGNKGLYFHKNEDQQRAKTVKSPSTEERIAVLVNRNRLIGNNYLEMLKTFLIDNFEEYSGQQGYVFQRDNYNKKTFFA